MKSEDGNAIEMTAQDEGAISVCESEIVRFHHPEEISVGQNP